MVPATDETDATDDANSTEGATEATDGANATDSAGDDLTHGDPDRAGQLHHLELYAADIDASVDFWGWLLGELGYEPKNDWAGGRSWINDPTYVVLVAADDEATSEHPFDRRGPGLNHVAFHAASREQVDAITEGVRERADASVLYEDRHPYAGGYYALYCEDPAGIKVEVVGPEA